MLDELAFNGGLTSRFLRFVPAMETVDSWSVQPVVTGRFNVGSIAILILTCSGGIAGIYAAVGEEPGVFSNISVSIILSLDQISDLCRRGLFEAGRCQRGCSRQCGGKGCEPAELRDEHCNRKSSCYSSSL